MSNEDIVRSWKDPEAHTAPDHPLGEPDLTTLTGGEEQITIFDICPLQTGCGTCGNYTLGCC
ncbi:hypothetical protein [Kitasatospora sp. NPDC001095]